MNNGITKITYAHDVTLVTLSSLPCDSTAVAGVLTAMSAGNINVDMISQTAPQAVPSGSAFPFLITPWALPSPFWVKSEVKTLMSSRKSCPGTARSLCMMKTW